MNAVIPLKQRATKVHIELQKLAAELEPKSLCLIYISTYWRMKFSYSSAWIINLYMANIIQDDILLDHGTCAGIDFIALVYTDKKNKGIIFAFSKMKSQES